MRIYESDELDPQTIDDVYKLGEVSHPIPDFVDTMSTKLTKRYYFGLTTFRVEMTFVNPNGKDVVKAFVVDQLYDHY